MILYVVLCQVDGEQFGMPRHTYFIDFLDSLTRSRKYDCDGVTSGVTRQNVINACGKGKVIDYSMDRAFIAVRKPLLLPEGFSWG